MGRISEIRTKRERAFYKQRMAGNRARALAEDRKLVEENQHLLPPNERYSKTENQLAEQMDLEDNEELDNELSKAMDADLGMMNSDEDEDEDEEEIKVAAKLKGKSILKQRGKLRVDGGVD
jgi:large subunit ribosomal protein L24e